MEPITKKVPMDLIDDPRIAMRTDVKDESIDQLMSDMQQVGLMEPILVRKAGERYEVIAGHRRTTAARLLQWPTIEAKIVDVDDDMALQMRTIENLSRKDVDPVDEACFIAEIMTRTKKTPAEMATIVHRSPEWVETRLQVFEMPDYLQEHLKGKRIPLGAALELNQIKDENTKRYYSNYAALNGTSVSQAKQWRIVVNDTPQLSEEQLTHIAATTPQFNEARKVVQCSRCVHPVYLDRAESVFIHPGFCSEEAPGRLE